MDGQSTLDEFFSSIRISYTAALKKTFLALKELYAPSQENLVREL